MFRSLIAFSLLKSVALLYAVAILCAIAVLPPSAEAGEPNTVARYCNSDFGVSFTGGPIFGRHAPERELGAPITGGPIFSGRHVPDQAIGAPITGGPIFSGRHIPDQAIGAPITGGPIFGRREHRSVCNTTPIVERPNRPFHFYGNSARRSFNKTGTRSN